MFPSLQYNRSIDSLYFRNLKSSDLPPDIRKLKKRKDVIIPDEVREAAERKSHCKLDTEFAKS